ncbi:hypothetical protein J6590_081373 [Homalodisca vitripennis]|nr:hypothetical protein J6590_081373 [Homalodisca vitripennis]
MASTTSVVRSVPLASVGVLAERFHVVSWIRGEESAYRLHMAATHRRAEDHMESLGLSAECQIMLDDLASDLTSFSLTSPILLSFGRQK